MLESRKGNICRTRPSTVHTSNNYHRIIQIKPQRKKDREKVNKMLNMSRQCRKETLKKNSNNGLNLKILDACQKP